MRLPSATTLVGIEVEENFNWWRSIVGADGCMYGIPFNGPRLAKFNPIDKTLTPIGPDLGDVRGRWARGGVLANNGCMYCLPLDESAQIRKLDTIHSTTTVLDVQLPDPNMIMRWISGALAFDGCIYFMPFNAHRILKLDLNKDSVCCVGDNFGGAICKHTGTVADSDGYVYGIPFYSQPIIRFDHVSHTTSVIGAFEDTHGGNNGGGVCGRDGCIYSFNCKHFKVLKMDAVNKSYSLVGNDDDFVDFFVGDKTFNWGDAVLGNDGCIHWPPLNSHRTLKLDIETQTTSLIGDYFGISGWFSGAVASDGAIYCLPPVAGKVFRIDPFQEFAMKLKADMKEHPEVLGFLFQTNKFDKTLYESAIIKYGKAKVFQVIEGCIPTGIEWEGIKTEAFMVAASCKNSNVDVIYHLLRRDLDQSPLANWSTPKHLSSRKRQCKKVSGR